MSAELLPREELIDRVLLGDRGVPAEWNIVPVGVVDTTGLCGDLGHVDVANDTVVDEVAGDVGVTRDWLRLGSEPDVEELGEVGVDVA